MLPSLSTWISCIFQRGLYDSVQIQWSWYAWFYMKNGSKSYIFKIPRSQKKMYQRWKESIFSLDINHFNKISEITYQCQCKVWDIGIDVIGNVSFSFIFYHVPPGGATMLNIYVREENLVNIACLIKIVATLCKLMEIWFLCEIYKNNEWFG